MAKRSRCVMWDRFRFRDQFRAITRARLVAFLAAVVFAAFAATSEGQVRYVYDDLGRLISVVDTTGESATYVYDAVGNLLSITRSSSAVRILGLSPQAGAV